MVAIYSSWEMLLIAHTFNQTYTAFGQLRYSELNSRNKLLGPANRPGKTVGGVNSFANLQKGGASSF